MIKFQLIVISLFASILFGSCAATVYDNPGPTVIVEPAPPPQIVIRHIYHYNDIIVGYVPAVPYDYYNTEIIVGGVRYIHHYRTNYIYRPGRRVVVGGYIHNHGYHIYPRYNNPPHHRPSHPYAPPRPGNHGPSHHGPGRGHPGNQ